MKLLLDRDSFVNQPVYFYGSVKAPARNPDPETVALRGRIYDYCESCDVAPTAQDLIEHFGVSRYVAKKVARQLGFQYIPRRDEGVDDVYSKIVNVLSSRFLPINRFALSKAVGVKGMQNAGFCNALNMLARLRPDLNRLVEYNARRGRKPSNPDASAVNGVPRRRVLPCRSKTPVEILRARIVAAYKVNPRASLLEIARLLKYPLVTLTAQARRLVDDDRLPDSILNADPLQVAQAFNQWKQDWLNDPAEMSTLKLEYACYMYGVEIADIRRFQAKTGFYLANEKKAYIEGVDAFTQEAIAIAARLSDALDRRASIKELATVYDVPAFVIERIKATPAWKELAQYVDENSDADGAALPFGGLFIEGAGEWQAPETWLLKIKSEGYMGIALTGGYWRRYFQLWERRCNGYTFKNGQWVDSGESIYNRRQRKVNANDD